MKNLHTAYCVLKNLQTAHVFSYLRRSFCSALYFILFISNFQSVTILAQETNIIKADEILKKALQMSANKKYSEAINLLDTSLKSLPNDALLFSAKSDILTNMGKHNEAIQYAIKAESLDSNYDWPKIILINNYLKLKKYNLAKKKIEDLKKIGKIYQYYSIKGQYHLNLKQHNEANNALNEAIKIKDSNGIREVKAWNYKLWGYPRYNLHELNKGLKIDPENTRLLIAKSTSYKNRRQFSKSIDTLHTALNSCIKNNSCLELSTEGMEKYFFTDSIKGAYIGKTTNSIYFSGAYKQNLYSTENILRSILADKIDINDSNNLIAMGYNPSIYFDFNISDVSRKRRIKNLSLSYEKTIDPQEQFALKQRAEIKADYIVPYWSDHLGDLSLNPYILVSYQEGNSGSFTNPSITGTYKIISADLGINLYTSPNFFKTNQRFKLGVTLGKNIVQDSHFGLLTAEYEVQKHFDIFPKVSFLNSNYFSLIIQGIHTKEIEAKFYDFRLKAQPQLNLKLFKHLSLILKNETIAHWDYSPPLFSEQLTALNILDVQLKIDALILKPKIRAQLLTGITEYAYDHLQFGAEIELTFWAKLSRYLFDHKLTYKQPLNFHVGYEQTTMLNNASQKRKKIESFYGSIKVFK